jgi:plasmid stability protein
MARLTIRNVDDEIVEKLKARAKANGRSLAAEVRCILTDDARQLTLAELRARAERFREARDR